MLISPELSTPSALHPPPSLRRSNEVVTSLLLRLLLRRALLRVRGRRDRVLQGGFIPVSSLTDSSHPPAPRLLRLLGAFSTYRALRARHVPHAARLLRRHRGGGLRGRQLANHPAGGVVVERVECDAERRRVVSVLPDSQSLLQQLSRERGCGCGRGERGVSR